MRLQRDSYAPKSCAFDAANVQFLRAHLCKSHPVLQHTEPTPSILLQNTIGQLGRENLAVCNPPGAFSGIGPFMSRLFIAPKLE